MYIFDNRDEILGMVIKSMGNGGYGAFDTMVAVCEMSALLVHTFTTRLVEAGVNIKVIQELCGHTRSDVTLDIYTTVIKELKQREFGNFEEKLKLQKQEWDKKVNSETEDEQ